MKKEFNSIQELRNFHNKISETIMKSDSRSDAIKRIDKMMFKLLQKFENAV